MFPWAEREPVTLGGDGPHEIWRCESCWANNDLTLVAIAHAPDRQRGAVWSQFCSVCDARRSTRGFAGMGRPWRLILIGGMVELDPDGAGQGPTEEGEANP